MTSIRAPQRAVILFAMVVIAAVLSFVLISPILVRADQLTMQLEFGMTNPQVGTLQTFLAQDSTIYPQGIVSNYFGFLTKSAVSNFQSRNGIATVGRVGPITLSAINNQMAGGVVSNTTEGAGKVTYVGIPQPILSNVQVTRTSNSATITWNSDVMATARVFYSATWPFVYVTAASATSNAGSGYAQSVTLNNLNSGTTYYFVAESLDARGNFSWSTNGVSFRTL